MVINKKINSFKGFTLIELTVVIIILGILAAVAMPRFTHLSRDARIAKLNAARGSVATAANLIHASLLTKSGRADITSCVGGQTASNTNDGSICTEHGLVKVINKYPAVTDFGASGAAAPIHGLLAASGLTIKFNPSRNELNDEGYDYVVTGTGVAQFSVLGSDDSTACSFTYQQAPQSNAAPIISAINTSGC